MIIEISGHRTVDFPDAPYEEFLIGWKVKKANELRKRFKLKDTDSILINVY